MRKKILVSLLSLSLFSVAYWFSGMSATSLRSSVLSQPDDTNPRITFTVDGQKDILIPPGKPLVFEWSSANIDTLSVSHSTNDKKKCDSAPLTNSIKGLQGIFKHSGWAKNDKFIGCTYEITVEGKQTSTGAVVRESVKMAVVAARSIPPSIVITKITTESGEVVTNDTNFVSGQNPTKLIVHLRTINVPKNAEKTIELFLASPEISENPRSLKLYRIFFKEMKNLSDSQIGEKRILVTLPDKISGKYILHVSGHILPSNPNDVIQTFFKSQFKDFILTI